MKKSFLSKKFEKIFGKGKDENEFIHWMGLVLTYFSFGYLTATYIHTSNLSFLAFFFFFIGIFLKDFAFRKKF